MITRLRAQNFKSWRDTGDLRLAPLTGLFGANSSGKSSILQTLLLLKQTIISPDPNRTLNLGGDEAAIVDLGTFADVAYAHNSDAVLQLSLDWNPELTWFRHANMLDPHPLTFNVALKEVDRSVRVSELTYSDKRGWKVGMRGRTDGMFDVISKLRDLDEQSDGPFPPPGGLGDFLLKGGNPKPALHNSFLYPIVLRNELYMVAYLGPLRHNPKRTYLWSGSKPSDVGRAGELAIQALLASRTEGQSVESDVASALKRMGLVSSFRLEPIAPNRRDYEVRVKTSEQGAEVLLGDVGFGVSQILPILVLCYAAPPKSVLIIEQPEVHLHPAAQSELADVLMDVVKGRSIQVIVESHSEHLLRRIQLRIAEEKFSADDAAMYFCEIENGESSATPLELTDDGFIKNWPKDFFGDEMGDLSAMTEAAAKRHIASAK